MDRRKKREKKYKAIKRAVQSKDAIFFSTTNSTDNLLRNSTRIISHRLNGERYVIGAHGAPHSIQIYEIDNIDAVTLAKIIKNRKDHNGEPIQLMCCSTGNNYDGTCFAQELANLTKVDVYAPPSEIYIESTGRYYIKSKSGILYGEDALYKFAPRTEG